MSNAPEFTVSEISQSIKRTIEDGYSYVRVRGELGRVTRPASGHLYLDLKDDKAVLNGVMWKGSASKLRIQPEQGMEVIASGRLTTFPGQSRYQIVIDTIEPAGVGALMALLEERKKKFAAEGLFAEERKKPIPFLPEVIGVVTSPSGAVIRDILHRLRDRFPSHVIVWPTLVQGDKADKQIAYAIKHFNRLPADGPVRRPDVLIVARGGGSLEDLWCFNEEIVVRAAADSDIPLISAVGHETDTTLIDYVSDRRAPTPTAAAEMAVPVRTELLAEVENKSQRLLMSQGRNFEARQMALQSASRGLGRADTILEIPIQRLDSISEGLSRSLTMRIDRANAGLSVMAARLQPATLRNGTLQRTQRLEAASGRLSSGMMRHVERGEGKIAGLRLPASVMQSTIRVQIDRLARAGQAIMAAEKRQCVKMETRLSNAGKLLESYSYKGVLSRGFALVLDQDGNVIRSAATSASGEAAIVQFEDGARDIVFDGEGKAIKKISTPEKIKPITKNPKKKSADTPQTSLFD